MTDECLKRILRTKQLMSRAAVGSQFLITLRTTLHDDASHKLHQVMTDKQTDLRNKTRAILVHPAVWSMNKQRIAVFL